MANFDVAISLVLQHEGGYSNNPLDFGGETNYGISKRNYPHEDIKNLTINRAKEIYHQDYWRFDNLANQDVANKLLDMEVNFGQGTAIQIAQRAIGMISDGIYGQATEAALNKANPTTLINELRARAACRHALIAIAEPKQSTFLLGWLRRDCS